VPAIPSWLLEPLWDQFAALLPDHPVYDPAHPLGCHRPRIADRIIFEKLVQVLRFGCSYESIADWTCSATTIRERRDEWIKAGSFARLKQIALDAYDRIVGRAAAAPTARSSRPAPAAESVARSVGGIPGIGRMCRTPARAPAWRRCVLSRSNGPCPGPR
jgi:transposase